MIPDRAGYYGCQDPTTRSIYVVKADSDLARQVVVFTGSKERDRFIAKYGTFADPTIPSNADKKAQTQGDCGIGAGVGDWRFG